MLHIHPYSFQIIYGGARGVMIIVIGNGYGDTNSNPGLEWLHFTEHKNPLEMYESNYSPSSYG